MKLSAIALGVLVGTTTLVHADGKHVLVLKSEGSVDAATRSRVDAAVLRLAKSSDASVTQGDITYGDAAAAVGCAPDSSSCTSEVLATLAVDEVVATTITPSAGNLKITVRRSSKLGSQDASTTVATSSADKLDGIGPLFGVTPSTPQAAGPDGALPPMNAGAANSTTASPIGSSLPPPTIPDDSNAQGHRNWQIAGMAGGGAMVLFGMLLWGAASSTQGEIDKAPSSTAADLKHLRDLEDRGDGQATLGNLMFVGGVVIGGISGYLFWRDGRARHAQTARIVPTLMNHGGGIAVVIGGSP